MILGEVEITLIEAARHLLGNSGEPAGHIAGLAYRDPVTRSLRINPPRDLMRDLDGLPLPAWDLIDAAAYRKAWTAAHGYFSLNMVSSRGCPYSCNWCSKPIYGDTYHFRSPRRVAEEMRFLKRTLAPDHIWFADDIFALPVHWTLEFAEAVQDQDARIPFKMQSCCDLMTREHGGRIAERESAAPSADRGRDPARQKVLDAMDKGLRVEKTYEACRNLRAHGIRVGLFLQFGYPGEDWDDIQSTIQMVRLTRPDDIGVSVAYPLPGTKFYNLTQLGAKKNWEDSDDLAMMFQGAYRSELYRALRDALHAEVGGSSAQDLTALWRQVEALKETSAVPNPTPLWTCC